MKRAGRMLVFIVCLGMLLLQGCGIVQASLISNKEEIEMGRNVAKQVEKQYGLVDDDVLQARVDAIGKRLAAVTERKDLPYTFKVLNSNEVNAFALPGGFIYVYKGLVDLMPSDEELAGVIGHELAHVVKRHSVKQMEKGLGMSLLFNLVFGDRGALLQSLAYNAIMADYSRDDEHEADHLGFLHSWRAGYNPYSMLMGMKKLAETEQKYHYDVFSDHPESQARLSALQQYLRDNHIRPAVVELPDGAQLVDGTWQLPAYRSEHDGYKPVYRAYFAAGNLYAVRQRSDYDPDKFIMSSGDSDIKIYYDEQYITTLTQQDAQLHKLSLNQLADTYIEQLKKWP